MAIEQTEQPLPFVVESFSLARVKLWGKFACGITDASQITTAQMVYLAFWHDARLYRLYEFALAHVEGAATGDMVSIERLIVWLGYLAEGVPVAIERWGNIVLCLQGDDGIVVLPRHLEDTNTHLVSLSRLLADIRQFGVAVCEDFGLSIPESFVEQSTSPTVQAAGEGVEGVASL